MLNPEIARRVDRLIKAQKIGVFSATEFGSRLGELVTADNLGEVLERIPPDLLEAFKESIVQDNKRVADDECLYPEESPFHQPPHIAQYYLKVGALLLENEKINRGVILSVTCMPSFEVEWALRLVESRKGNYSLLLATANEKIWQKAGTSPIPVLSSKAILLPELAELVCEVWRKMLQRTRHPSIGRFGLDGVSYHFFYHGPGVGRMAGRTWSPEGQTGPGKLVALSEMLRRYVLSGKKERPAIEQELRPALEWFRELP
jgi:hypothetical protein